MSDILSPLLIVMKDEGQAYISFCSLMSRMAGNFFSDGKLMTTKFEHLSQLIQHIDPEFYSYLKFRHSDDLLFCYRWLLLELKREFSFEDACLALEVLWSSLPPPTQSLKSLADGGGVQLYEHRFWQPTGKNVDNNEMGSEENFDISSTTKLQTGCNLQGAHCVSIKQNQCRPGTAYSNLVSARKRARSEEDGVLPRLMTNSSIKEASSNTFVTRSRRIQSAGSAEEEIIRAREGNKSHDKTSLETGYSKPELQLKTFKDKDAEKSNRFKVQQLEKDHRSQRGREEESKEPRRTCIQRKFPCNILPKPTELGGGNPFLMFMCLACIIKHRDCILEQQLDYQEIAMYYDKLTRRHNVQETLDLARTYFAQYLNEDWKKEAQNDIQDQCRECSDSGNLGKNQRKC